MRSEHLLISLVGLGLGMCLLLFGFFLFLTPFVPLFAKASASVVLEHLGQLSIIGLGLCVLGALFLAACLYLSRRRYLLLKMGGVFVEDKLIALFAKEGLEKLFPGQKVECDAIVKGKTRVEILANIPYVCEKKQSETFEKIEVFLSAFLRQQCRFEREFIFNVGFISPKRE